MTEKRKKRGRNICGVRLANIRKYRKIKQVDVLAELELDYNISMHQSCFSDLEHGLKTITDEQLKAFAEIYEINADWVYWVLFGGTEPDKLIKTKNQILN